MKQDAKELVNKAFEMARAARKSDWHRMTTAVLKNRLLAITKNEFREADYGARNMIEFVHGLGELVTIDKDSWPPIVELPQPGAAATGPEERAESISFDRIRTDLWQAIMDYRSGIKYVWDATLGVARPQSQDDHAPLMPTISAEDDMRWRNDFARKQEGIVDEIAKSRITAFTARGVSPRILPPHILPQWNEFVKSQILKTLADWAAHHNITLPERLTVSATRTLRVVTKSETEDLRELILSCVKAMSQSELRTVSLPPSVVLRVRRGKG